MIQFQEMTIEYTRKLVSTAPVVTILYIRRKDINYSNYTNTIIIKIKDKTLRQWTKHYNWKTKFRYIESNTGKSARQGNLIRLCRRFPCIALYAGV